MREISVGIRIDMTEGISFLGTEEVNGLINRGGKVVSIEPGGAIMHKIGEEGGNVRLTLSGCEMKVIVDDSAVESSPETKEHNRLHQEGFALISSYMLIIDRESKPADSQEAQEELRRGIELLNQAIVINPANWSAYWLIGKAHQAMGNSTAAVEAFGKSYGLQKGNADVAREYMFECLNLGETNKAIGAARHAVRLNPDDPGLVANLALALFIGGQLDEAAGTVIEALKMRPGDEITQNLKQMIDDVRAGLRSQPSKLSDLNAT